MRYFEIFIDEGSKSYITDEELLTCVYALLNSTYNKGRNEFLTDILKAEIIYMLVYQEINGRSVGKLCFKLHNSTQDIEQSVSLERRSMGKFIDGWSLAPGSLGTIDITELRDEIEYIVSMIRI